MYTLDTDITIVITDGNYTVRGLNEYMMKIFGKDPPVKFGIIEARQRISIKLKKDWVIDFTKSNFPKIIGFLKSTYGSYDEETEVEGEHIADISNGNDNIYIHCDVVKGSLINQYNSEVIYSFTNKNPPGSIISKEFNNWIYFPVKVDPVERIKMRITNQKGELIDLNKGAVEFNFISS